MSYVATDWAHAQHPKKPNEKFLLIVLAHHHNRLTGRCDPSINRLMEESGFSRHPVLNAIKGLEEQGFISVKRKHRRVSQYAFHMEHKVSEEHSNEDSRVQEQHSNNDPKVSEEHPKGVGGAPNKVSEMHSSGAPGAPQQGEEVNKEENRGKRSYPPRDFEPSAEDLSEVRKAVPAIDLTVTLALFRATEFRAPACWSKRFVGFAIENSQRRSRPGQTGQPSVSPTRESVESDPVYTLHSEYLQALIRAQLTKSEKPPTPEGLHLDVDAIAQRVAGLEANSAYGSANALLRRAYASEGA